MGIIFFVASSVSGKVEGLICLAEMSEEMVTKEFCAVITIEAQKVERKRLLDMVDLFKVSYLPLAL